MEDDDHFLTSSILARAAAIEPLERRVILSSIWCSRVPFGRLYCFECKDFSPRFRMDSLARLCFFCGFPWLESWSSTVRHIGRVRHPSGYPQLATALDCF